MLKVLLVDDEPMDAALMHKALADMQPELQIVGTAADGQIATQMEEQLRPDIIITDLFMPIKNGVEFVAEVKAKRPHVHVIFISGHRNFEFAQFGIDNAVDSYLLKPITPARLREAVAASAQACVEAKRRVFEQQTFRTLLDENMPKLRHIFLNELIMGEQAAEDIPGKLAFFGVELADERLCVIVLRSDQPSAGADISRRQLSQFEVSDAIGEIIESMPGVCAFARSDDEHVLVLNCTEQMLPWVGLLAQSILRNIKTMCNQSFTAGVSVIGRGFASLPVGYRTACIAAEYRFFTGKGQVIFYQDIVEEQQRRGPSLFQVHFARGDIARAVAAGNEEQLRRLLDAMREQLLAQKHTTAAAVRNPCVELLSACINQIGQVNEAVVQQVVGDSCPYNHLYNLVTLQDIVQYVSDFLLRLCQAHTRSVYDRHAQIVQAICQIIDQRMDQNLTVESIAEEIYLSRGYATQVFKKSTGKSIGRYLISARIRRAQELLCHTTMRIADIAASVGYDNATYFSSLFKNEVGIAPKEYRIRHAEPAVAGE